MSYLGTTKIGKMYLGNTGIAKAYLGNTLVYQNGGGPTPPIPTNIAYIRGGVGSYIDTGITPDNTTRVIVWARNFNPGAGNLFGSRTSSTSNRFCLLTPGGANSGRIRIDYGNANDAYADDQFATLSHYHKYEYYQGVLKIDDVTIASTGTQPTFSGTYNLYLFGNNNAGTLQSLNVPADICACQIYKGGTLVRDFTPVESPSVGLYDAVSETVFTNSGTGSFTYGTFNSSAYTPLEYIECDGGQYFDSGLDGNYGLSITLKHRPTGTAKRFYYPLGCHIYPNYRCGIQHGNTTTANKYTTACYSNAVSNLYSTVVTGNDLVVTKNNNVFTAYKNNTQLGTYTGDANTSFSVGLNVFVGTINNSGTANMSESFVGRLYYVGFGTQKNFVPAKVSGVAGMYDTYNDVFKPSESGTPFLAGPSLNL